MSPGSVPPSAPVPSDLLGRGYGRASGTTATWEGTVDQGAPSSYRGDAPPTIGSGDAGPEDAIYRQDFKSFRDQWIQVGEREYLRRLLERHQRNVVAAAKEADVDRTHIYRLMRKHGL
jgi:DNA-binding NtrC family response regulator